MFNKVSVEEFWNEVAAVIKDCTKLFLLVDDILAKAIGLRERFCAMDYATRFIVEASCAQLGPSLRDLAEYFRVGFHKSVNEAFQAGSIDS